MNWFSFELTRREFLKGIALSGAGIAMDPLVKWSEVAAEFPKTDKLGRVTLVKVDMRARPTMDSPVVKTLPEDTVVPWLREVVGDAPNGLYNRRWVETEGGYLYAPRLQPVKNVLNKPLETLPETGGKKGFWAEVTVPYLDYVLANPPARSPRLKETNKLRVYYSEVFWIDEIRKDANGKIQYHVTERYGSYGDIYWAAAEGFRPITEQELAPIRPEVENKRAVVNLTRQTMTCYEGNSEVYFCRVSTGAKWDADGNAVDAWSTPPGKHPISRKFVSLRMSGRTTGDWEAVAWTTIFANGGVAVHSTYWHNEFGLPRSHGCVNCAPEDAKWVFLWTLPHCPAEPGMYDAAGVWPIPASSIIEVVE